MRALVPACPCFLHVLLDSLPIKIVLFGKVEGLLEAILIVLLHVAECEFVLLLGKGVHAGRGAWKYNYILFPASEFICKGARN